MKVLKKAEVKFQTCNFLGPTEVIGQKTVQNDKNFCPFYSIS